VGETGGKRLWVLGGNEGDAVAVAPFAKVASRIGLVGYWWPASVALPAIGPIPYTSTQHARPTTVT
jgi:hypothetical protein